MLKKKSIGTKSKRKSLSTKISFSLLAVLVPLLAILVITSCIMAAKSIEELNDKLLEAQTDYSVSMVDDFFSDKAGAISMFDHNPIFQAYFQNVNQPDDIVTYENKYAVLDQLKNALDNMLEGKAEQCWLADPRTDRFLLSTGEIAPAELAAVTWDDDVLSSKDTVISEPYLDSASGKMVVSIVSPVFVGSNVTGFAGFDVFLDSLAETLSGIKVGEEGYLELISKSSEYIYSDDENAIGKNVSEIEISDEYKTNVQNKYEGVMDFDYAGIPYTSMSRISDATGWMVIATLPMSEVDATRNQLILVLAILSIAILLVMVFVIIALIRKSMRPLTEISADMREFAQGNLGVDIQVRSDDEIGALAEDVSSTIHTLKEIIDDISSLLTEISNGNLDLQVKGNYVGDFAPIRAALEGIIQSLNYTMTQINQASEQVSSGSDQVSSGAQALSQGATQQASSVEELAATITEISGHVKGTADNAALARKQTNEAGGQLGECNEQMQEMIKAMSEISDKSNEIGKIIKTIEDIAFQTNILALNAAVEAARAGVAGKGFAVVADEVRNLASKSAEASKNTSTLIEGSITAVEKGTRLAGETAESLEKVVEGAQLVEGMVEKIAAAANEQASSITQVTVGIDQIASVVQTNSATAEESAAASEELSGQAQMLKDLIRQFRLKTTSSGFTPASGANHAPDLNSAYDPAYSYDDAPGDLSTKY